MTDIDRADVTAWFLALVGSSGFPAALHRAPVDQPGDDDFPYTVVHPIPGGGYSGPPLTGPQADVDFVYQVDSVGNTSEQAERLATRNRRRVVGRDVNGAFIAAAAHPSGWKVRDRMLDGAPGGVAPSGTQPHEVYTVSERYVVSVTPTA